MNLLRCWFSHNRVQERDEAGNLILVCQDCRHTIPALSTGELLKGPAHTPQPVLGQPTGKAVKATWFARTKVS